MTRSASRQKRTFGPDYMRLPTPRARRSTLLWRASQLERPAPCGVVCWLTMLQCPLVMNPPIRGMLSETISTIFRLKPITNPMSYQKPLFGKA